MVGDSVNRFDGSTENMVQARDIHGDLHVHSPQRSTQLISPRQLPADVPGFAGRADELARLDSLLEHGEPGTATAVVICAIAGTAGVGKTALAVHWAHRVRDQFPDGQLYIDLLGYAADSPVTPSQALEGFLHALGVPGELVPDRLDAQAALYRSLLDARRVLVVLDNANSPEQVRPLLPGSSGCIALVTSRSSLGGLVSRNGAERLTLDLLPPDEALVLLRTIAGTSRIDAEPESAQQLIDQCGRLPLALRIAAERAAGDPHAQLGDLVAELADEQQRLDLLASEEDHDAATAVRAVFSWSYRGLTPAAAHLFRLLGLHPGPDIGLYTAAALAGREPRDTKRLLQVLVDAHLIQPTGRARYRFHDVLRVYASELAEATEASKDRTKAVQRMLGWYLRAADEADHLLLPHHRRVPLHLPEPTSAPLPFTSREEALKWCELETANLVTAVRYAAHIGQHTLAAQFPRALWSYFDLRKPWTDWIPTYETGLRSARQIGNRDTEAWTTSALGVPYYDLRRFDEAIPYFAQALAIRREIGDRWGEAGSLANLGACYRRQRRFAEALECFIEALQIRQEIGDRRGEAGILNRLGSTYRDLERFEEALDSLHDSLAIRREIGDQHGEGFALHSLGATFEQLGLLDDAEAAYTKSLEVRRVIGDRRGEADALYCLGKLIRRSGRTEAAREAWTEALTIFTALGSPQADDVLAQLQDLPQQ